MYYVIFSVYSITIIYLYLHIFSNTKNGVTFNINLCYYIDIHNLKLKYYLKNHNTDNEWEKVVRGVEARIARYKRRNIKGKMRGDN